MKTFCLDSFPCECRDPFTKECRSTEPKICLLYKRNLADMQTQIKELVPDSLKENGERRMSDLISRQVAIEAAMQDVSDKRSHDFNAGATRAANRIKLLPTVDAEPVRHGNWEPFDEDEYSCSLCGNIFVTMDGGHPLSNGFKFCPFCGAKMDERKEE